MRESPRRPAAAAYRSATAFFSLVTFALGIAMIAIGFARGGSLGIVLGLMFVAAGGGRLYLLRRSG